MMKIYRANKVLGVTITGYDPDGTRSEDFFGEQVLFGNNKLKTITRSGVTDESQLLSDFDDQSRITRTQDTSGSMVSITTYNYDAAGKLVLTKSISSDTTQSINEIEEHKWFYKTSGTPERMLRIKNASDTTEIRFVTDESGNVSEEQSFKKGIAGETVYYYYDDKNRLTDVVRFNKRAGRLLPDYMFEYSSSNQVIQKITVPPNNSEYLIWRFQYDARGLKVKEACFTRNKQMTGKIEYQYRFGS
jgi:YD repeat-containing protein